MGRSGALLLAAEIVLVPAFGALGQDTETPAFWDGFYFGILSGVPAAAPAGAAGVTAAAGSRVNETFYSGAEAFLSAKGLNGAEPFLWLEGDGRLGARVTETMLLAGSGEDADQRQLALNGAAGAELLLAERVTAGPAGFAGVVFKME